jgi:hypothetical protein
MRALLEKSRWYQSGCFCTIVLIVIRIVEEFRGLAWSEVKPQYLDHEYCQILLIGEKIDAGLQPTQKDQKHDKETPMEEIEKLEHEDELRVEHLHGEYPPLAHVVVEARRSSQSFPA